MTRPTSNLSHQERNPVTILPEDKCIVVLSRSDYHSKMAELFVTTTPTVCYKKKVIDCLQELEKEKPIDRAMYYLLYPGESTSCIYGLPQNKQRWRPTQDDQQQHKICNLHFSKTPCHQFSPTGGQ